jgi:hypothetical protein
VNERHTYIVPGISREAFQDVGVQATIKDSSLSYFLHAHPYDPFGRTPCNDKCQIIRTGKVEYVTRSDAAKRGGESVK